MSIAIRPLEPAGRAAWEPLWQGYLTFYETELKPEITAQTWQRLITDGEDPSGFCAVDDDGTLIGIVHYLFHRSCWTIGDYCYLQDLFVAPGQRGTGTGRALIEAVYTAAREQGASQVYWLTQHFNDTARQLYDRIGDQTPFIKYTHALR